METPLSDEMQAMASVSAAICTAVIIANPTSGSFYNHHQDPYQETLTYLREQHWQVELWATSGPGDAQNLARKAVEQGISVVIASGGDGTINEIIQGLAGSETALGVLPNGTVNVWAREMGIPLDHVKAREILAHGQTRRIDLGRVNERYFLLMVGIGFDGEVAQAVQGKPLKRLGVLGYVLAALWFGTGYLGFPVTLKVDGADPVRTRALQIFAGNTRLYAGAVNFTWQAFCDDGLLDLCVVHKRGPLGRLLMLGDFVLKHKRRRLWVRYNTFKEVLVETQSPVAIQVDGDPAGYTPATLTVAPGALKVVLPLDVPPELFSQAEDV